MAEIEWDRSVKSYHFQWVIEGGVLYLVRTSDFSGTVVWFKGSKEGEVHRELGPAVIFNDGEEWYQNGVVHRDGGPARICSDGSQEWYQHGRRIACPAKVVESVDWIKEGF